MHTSSYILISYYILHEYHMTAGAGAGADGAGGGAAGRSREQDYNMI